MKRLLDGIFEFHEKVRPHVRERFAQLALGQSPDCLFVACSDSRVVPNLFASTDPGDLFVVRNVGNLIPPCGAHGHSTSDRSEAAAIEFSVLNLGVRDVIVCGHSECGAMHALLAAEPPAGAVNLAAWLECGRESLARLGAEPTLATGLALHNRLSQANVLQQLEHIKTYPAVAERVADGRLGLHGWWFDIAAAEVLAWHAATRQFVPITESDERPS